MGPPTARATSSSATLVPESVTANSPQKRSIFSPELRSERLWMYRFTFKSLLISGVGLFCVLPFYWGSYYGREGRIGNIKVFVYNQDKSLIGNTLVSVLPDTLGWEVQHGDLSLEQITDQIFQQEAWAAIVIAENATASLQNALETANSNFSTQGLINLIYEKERDLLTIPYILPFFSQLHVLFGDQAGSRIIKPLVSNMTDTQQSNLVNHASNLLASSFSFQHVDMSTYEAQILTAVLQVGLLYLIIIAFSQIAFFAALHQRMASRLDFRSVITYRLILGFSGYFFVSLFTCLVSLAFNVRMDLTFGKAGFLVYWAVTYITMMAVGMANENISLLLAGTYPPLFGFWLIFWVLANISPAFSALELCSPFFRYGLAMPLLNALELDRVVLVGTTKKNMGRNVGVLVAWLVADIVFMPFCVKFFQYRIEKKGTETRPTALHAEMRKEDVEELGFAPSVEGKLSGWNRYPLYKQR